MVELLFVARHSLETGNAPCEPARRHEKTFTSEAKANGAVIAIDQTL